MLLVCLHVIYIHIKELNTWSIKKDARQKHNITHRSSIQPEEVVSQAPAGIGINEIERSH